MADRRWELSFSYCWKRQLYRWAKCCDNGLETEGLHQQEPDTKVLTDIVYNRISAHTRILVSAIWMSRSTPVTTNTGCVFVFKTNFLVPGQEQKTYEMSLDTCTRQWKAWTRKTGANRQSYQWPTQNKQSFKTVYFYNLKQKWVFMST